MRFTYRRGAIERVNAHAASDTSPTCDTPEKAWVRTPETSVTMTLFLSNEGCEEASRLKTGLPLLQLQNLTCLAAVTGSGAHDLGLRPGPPLRRGFCRLSGWDRQLLLDRIARPIDDHGDTVRVQRNRKQQCLEGTRA
jgi:hypothetical protein